MALTQVVLTLQHKFSATTRQGRRGEGGLHPCQDSFSSCFPASFRILSSPQGSCGHYLFQKQSQHLHHRRTCVSPPNLVYLISGKTMTCPGEGGKINLSPPQLHPQNYWIWGKFSRLETEEWMCNEVSN